MFRNKTKIILIIVLIFQFISPLGLLVYQANIQNKLNTLEANVRLEVDSISTDVGYITIEPRIYYEDAVNIDEYLSNFAEDYNYISFVGYDNEGYSKYSFDIDKPDQDIYVGENLYDFYFIEIPFEDDFEKFGDCYWNIYHKENEKENIAAGYFEGPETEAYIDLTVRNGRFVVKDVIVNGMSLEEYVKACDSGEINIERFQTTYYNDDFNLGEYYDSLNQESQEMVDDLAGKILQ
jgi:hypothetical protein